MPPILSRSREGDEEEIQGSSSRLKQERSWTGTFSTKNVNCLSLRMTSAILFFFLYLLLIFDLRIQVETLYTTCP